MKQAVIFFALLSLVWGDQLIPTFKNRADGDDTPFIYKDVSPDQNSYTWWYEYPGQYHIETRDPNGVVSGSVKYVDSLGSDVKYNYKADAENGFVVDNVVNELPDNVPSPSVLQAPLSTSPLLQVLGQGVDSPLPSPSVEEHRDFDLNSDAVLFRAAKPNTVFARFGQLSGYDGHFFVPLGDVEERGGTSALAAWMGVRPIAAVHNAQIPRFN